MRGQQAAGFHRRLPFRATNLVDCFHIGHNPKIPGRTKPRQKIYLIGQRSEFGRWLDIRIKGRVKPGVHVKTSFDSLNQFKMLANQ